MPQDICKTLPKPPWYNDVASGAILPSGTQMGATCGLHAVNHLLAVSSKPALHQVSFVALADEKRLGDRASNLYQPGGHNYDIAVLTINLDAHGLSLFPMSPADIEGSAGKMSILSGSRLANPWGGPCHSGGLSYSSWLFAPPSKSWRPLA